jgi:hypothetical protein
MKKYCSGDYDRFTNSLKHASVFISGSQIGFGMTPDGPEVLLVGLPAFLLKSGLKKREAF